MQVGRSLAAGALALLVLASAAAADPLPFGHPCTAQYGVRFCPTATLSQRVPSFDGVPLDADVTLPPAGGGPFPTIVMLHWLGGDKTTYETTSPSGAGSATYDFNNVYFAQRGYAVLTYSSRGVGASCGTQASRTAPGCSSGWSHFADQRYEARDTQTLLGQLVDEGIAAPGALGVTGESYAGGEAVELAYLRNRIRLPDGSFAPWRSPAGTPLSIAAAYALWPWTDLTAAVMPNGALTDSAAPTRAASLGPVGVELQSELYNIATTAQASTWVAAPDQDPSIDLQSWFGALDAGEPYGAAAQTALAQLYDYHQGYGLTGEVAPLLIQSGFTDDLFGAGEALATYDQQRALDAAAPVALQLGDVGHPPASNKPAEVAAFAQQASAFLDAWLRSSGTPPSPGSVTAYTLTCPGSVPASGPWTAPTYAGLQSGSTSFGSAAPQQVSSGGGNQQLAAAADPVIGDRDPCAAAPVVDEPGTAVYTTASPGLTVIGAPTINATVAVSGSGGELAMRLWDVLPDGYQRLVGRGVLRLADNEAGHVSVQLHPLAYTFGAGDTIRLELLGRDAPYYRASNDTFTVTVSGLTVSLPTAGRWDELVNEGTGKCVDAAGWGTSDGTAVQQWTCGGPQANQEWQPQPAGGGFYELLNRNASGEQEVLDVTGASVLGGAPVQLWTYAGAPNQQWRAVALGNGYYELVSRLSGKCLDVTGGSAADGARLQQWDCYGGPNQAFTLTAAGP